MNKTIALVGVGEMGSVFAHGLLRSGSPIVPVLRSTPIDEVAVAIPDPALALVTVGEDDLGGSLDRLPDTWRSKVGLIQNELLPRDWLSHAIDTPTVAVVWFEKKPGRPVKVILPTPVAGPAAGMLVASLESIGIPAVQIGIDQLIEALVAKNLYILTANIVGLRTGGTVSHVWAEHHSLACAVASEILDIQEWLVGSPIDRDRAVEGMTTAFAGDPDHAATGRSAPRRLERAVAHARAASIPTPYLDEISREEARTV